MDYQALAHELRLWETLNHPNILQIVGFYLNEQSLDYVWLVTWWQETDVIDYIARTQPDLSGRLDLVSCLACLTKASELTLLL